MNEYELSSVLCDVERHTSKYLRITEWARYTCKYLAGGYDARTSLKLSPSVVTQGDIFFRRALPNLINMDLVSI